VRRHRPTARLLSLLLLAAVLASGLGGQAPGVASAVGDAAARPFSLIPGSRAAARTVPPAGIWRPVTQDEEGAEPSADCDVRGIVESPAEGATVPAGPLTITGWAADINSTEGTGIDEVRVSLDADPDQGGVPVSATYGIDRPDIAELLGDPRFTASGFTLAWDSTSTTPGPHVLYVQVHGNCGWTGTARSVVVAGAAAPTAPAAVATTPATTPTAAATGTATSAAATSATLVFPTVPVMTPTAGTPSAQAAGAQAGAAQAGLPTVPLVTATVAPSPTGSIPAPTNVTASLNPIDGSIFLQWAAPPAMVTSYQIVVNEADGSQRPIRDVPGSATRAQVGGLDPRIGYSLSVVPIDSFGRRGTPSAPVSTAGAPTATPIPTPTLSPYCTPVPFGPPICPPPGVNPAAFPGGVYPGAPGVGCPPEGPFGISGPYGAPGLPYGAPGPYGFPGQMGVPNPFGAPSPFGFPPQGYPPGAYPPQGCYGGFGAGSFQLTAIPNGSTATLSWTPAPGAISYTIWQGVNGQPLTQLQSAGNTTTVQVPLSQPGASYVFQVHAQVSNGPELLSNIAPLTGTGVGYPIGVPGVGNCTAPGQPCASRSTAAPSAPTAPAAQGMQINVTVLDMNGQPVVGAPVNIAPSGGTGVVQTPVATSGPGGIATFFVRANAPGPATFTITINGQPLPAPVTVTFT